MLLEPGGGLGELGNPVHAVVIGDGERLEPEAGGFGDELTGSGRPVEEAERGVAVQFGPRDAAGFRPPDQLARGGRRRLGVGGLGLGRLAFGSPGHAAPELGPRDRRVIPAHG